MIWGCPGRAPWHPSQHPLPTGEVLLDLTAGMVMRSEGWQAPGRDGSLLHETPGRVGQRRQARVWVFLGVRWPPSHTHSWDHGPRPPSSPWASRAAGAGRSRSACLTLPAFPPVSPAWAATGGSSSLVSPPAPHWPPEGSANLQSRPCPTSPLAQDKAFKAWAPLSPPESPDPWERRGTEPHWPLFGCGAWGGWANISVLGVPVRRSRLVPRACWDARARQAHVSLSAVTKCWPARRAAPTCTQGPVCAVPAPPAAPSSGTQPWGPHSERQHADKPENTCREGTRPQVPGLGPFGIGTSVHMAALPEEGMPPLES